MSDVETIAAQATPPGRGGVGIIRVSGPRALYIAQRIIGRTPKTRYAEFCNFLSASGSTIDQGIAIYFKAPYSFTGEDVLELQGHGGQVILDIVLSRVLELGARIAQPGEFSKRAFLNDKIDLAQAEAIADLINAQSNDAARSAIRSLAGEFSSTVKSFVDNIVDLRIFVESAIDFPEEEIDFLSDTKIRHRLEQLAKNLENVFSVSRQGSLLNEGVRVMILGQPNVGKSSLLNRLSGEDVAIVSHVAGTTRDLLRQQISIDGLPIQIVDTAGLRNQADPIEQEGISRAKTAAVNADHILYLVDDQFGVTDTDRENWQNIPSIPTTIVFNKIDLTQRHFGLTAFEDRDAVSISTTSGVGLAELKRHLLAKLGIDRSGEGLFFARRRHLDSLNRAKNAILTAIQIYDDNRAGEFIAEELRQAQSALNEITGEFDNEALLERIFSSFCIGK